jgi:hypothetical protein
MHKESIIKKDIRSISYGKRGMILLFSKKVLVFLSINGSNNFKMFRGFI